MIAKFSGGQKIYARSSFNYTFVGEVVSRANKTAVLRTVEGINKYRIEIEDGCEVVYPFGRYLAAPVFRADL